MSVNCLIFFFLFNMRKLYSQKFVIFNDIVYTLCTLYMCVCIYTHVCIHISNKIVYCQDNSLDVYSDYLCRRRYIYTHLGVQIVLCLFRCQLISIKVSQLFVTLPFVGQAFFLYLCIRCVLYPAFIYCV